MNSLDPRVSRLPVINGGKPERKAPLDQFGTFEVFVQPKEGKPFQHEGIVHAPNLEMAYVLAKEAFTRRFLCISLCVTDTRHVWVSPTSEGIQSVFELLKDQNGKEGAPERYEVYVLPKRGKQHLHAGAVEATSPMAAMKEAKQLWTGKPAYNIWAIRSSDFRFTSAEDYELWNTLPEKKFRDASDYKGGDKLKAFLERVKT